MNAWLLAGLAAGTFVSEDLACVLAGVLVLEGRLDPVAAIAACAVGIWVGDLGLWAVGRLLGSRVLTWPRVRRLLTPERSTRFAEWFEAHAASAILASRFVPGTRVPLYLAAGALGGSPGRFAFWSMIAVALWTPPIVLVSAGVVLPLAATPALDNGIVRGVALVGVVMAWRGVMTLATERRRQRAIAVVSRVWQWEFWPMWLFYAPVTVWLSWLVLRHRGIGAISAANPGMPDGGIVGESKIDILSRLPASWTIPAVAIAPGPLEARAWQLATQVSHRGWRFPLILKPDVGQRGVGVRLVQTLEEARAYLTREVSRTIVQPYHPGPYEAGVFYYRFPGWPRGRILSITDKCFPVVTGDGQSTLEELIWRDGRLRMQATRFLERHAAHTNRVLERGERLPLAVAGNHAQGTLFRDGRHLITPSLEDRIDSIARSYHGFFIGRFDIRYSDVARFKAGEDLAIVELNGATAESTNIYDPAGSLLDAYRQLFKQWSLVFAIGAANQRLGARASSLKRLLELIRAHRATRVAFETSD
jgi:membrane protein DedA with SNARE-associated domain